MLRFAPSLKNKVPFWFRRSIISKPKWHKLSARKNHYLIVYSFTFDGENIVHQHSVNINDIDHNGYRVSIVTIRNGPVPLSNNCSSNQCNITIHHFPSVGNHLFFMNCYFKINVNSNFFCVRHKHNKINCITQIPSFFLSYHTPTGKTSRN